MALNPLVQRFLDSLDRQALPVRAKTEKLTDPVVSASTGHVTTGGSSPSGTGGGAAPGLGGQLFPGLGAQLGLPTNRGRPPTGNGWEGLNPKVQDWVNKTLAKFGSQGLTFSSGYRDPAHNAAVGGVPNSGHTRGWKADFSGDEQLLRKAADWLSAWGAKVLIHGREMGHSRNHLDVSWERMYQNR